MLFQNKKPSAHKYKGRNHRGTTLIYFSILSLTRTKREILPAYALRSPVQKLPSIRTTSNRLAADERFSLSGFWMYSSFSSPFTVFYHNESKVICQGCSFKNCFLLTLIIINKKFHNRLLSFDIEYMFLFQASVHPLMLIKTIITACICKQIKFLQFFLFHIV